MNHISTPSLVIGMHVRDMSDDTDFFVSSVKKHDFNLWQVTTSDGDVYMYDSWDKFEVLKD